MKILLVSMPSLHVMRWVENIDQSQHELFWFDVMGRGVLHTPLIPKTKQFVNWKTRKIKYIKGEFFLSKRLPEIYNKIKPVLEVTEEEQFLQLLATIQPDVVHSFEMQNCSYPLLKPMQKYSNLKWIYSCWGSDVYHYAKLPKHRKKIRAVLQRVNYLITDCKRDETLATELGFRGTYLGTIFGGGGFKQDKADALRQPLANRRIVLVKGYEHEFGRALSVVKALQALPAVMSHYDVRVFATHEIVQNYIETQKLPITIYGRHNLSQEDVLALMGKTLISIGNSISDGMPNTLLESIIMGAFPIQSNPGGATEDVIVHEENGLLIQNPEAITEIKTLILNAIRNREMLERAYKMNTEEKAAVLEYTFVKQKITHAYTTVEAQVKGTH